MREQLLFGVRDVVPVIRVCRRLVDGRPCKLAGKEIKSDEPAQGTNSSLNQGRTDSSTKRMTGDNEVATVMMLYGREGACVKGFSGECTGVRRCWWAERRRWTIAVVPGTPGRRPHREGQGSPNCQVPRIDEPPVSQSLWSSGQRHPGISRLVRHSVASDMRTGYKWRKENELTACDSQMDISRAVSELFTTWRTPIIMTTHSKSLLFLSTPTD